MQSPQHPLFWHDLGDVTFFQADNSRWPAATFRLHRIGITFYRAIYTSWNSGSRLFQIHCTRCTRTKAFRNGSPRNDWVWVQASGEKSYGDLPGWVVAWLLALFKIRNVLSGNGNIHSLAMVHILDPASAGRFHCESGHIQVSKQSNSWYMRIVGIGVVIGQPHVIPSRERQLIVNHRIDLQIFNNIY